MFTNNVLKLHIHAKATRISNEVGFLFKIQLIIILDTNILSIAYIIVYMSPQQVFKAIFIVLLYRTKAILSTTYLKMSHNLLTMICYNCD